jgi:quercetin dioxygenase-like cupin family protein
MSIVISGELQLMVKGQPTKTLHAGDSFMVPRDTPHDAKNIGTTPAVVAVTYVIDAGAPMRSPVP